MNLSVVICVRNEEKRLRECLETVYANNPDEVILVDGHSTDNTVAIAREFQDIVIVESFNSSLTRDRQKGLDTAKNQLVAMVDADHRLRPGDLASLLADMQKFQFDIVQSGLVSPHQAWLLGCRRRSNLGTDAKRARPPKYGWYCASHIQQARFRLCTF